MKKRFYFETTETKITQTKGHMEVETDYVQIYKNFVKISGKINSVTTFKLLHWLLAERLTDDNGLHSGSMFADFNKYLQEDCGSESSMVSKATFYRSLQELVETGAINKIDQGHYFANANLFWADDTQKRYDHLQLNAKDDNPKLKLINP